MSRRIRVYTQQESHLNEVRGKSQDSSCEFGHLTISDHRSDSSLCRKIRRICELILLGRKIGLIHLFYSVTEKTGGMQMTMGDNFCLVQQVIRS